VYRVERADGPTWGGRLFPEGRPRARGDGGAGILPWLPPRDYPAERLPPPEPVSLLDGQPLLVTAYVPPVPRYERRTAIAAAGGLRVLGWLLGRLHTLG